MTTSRDGLLPLGTHPLPLPRGGVFHAVLGPASDIVRAAGQDLEAGLLSRIWARDHTVWSPDPHEISNRLGWLDAPERMTSELDEIDQFREEVIGEGITDIVLLGMGGSSLAPETFGTIFVSDRATGSPNLTVIDTSDPDAIRDRTERLPLRHTLIIVATKSGTTVETVSGFKYLYRRAARSFRGQPPGQRFVAITDPGSPLHDTAETLGFRHVFLADPHVGGRYSALTHFGLVPAGVIGIDLRRLLDRTLQSSGTACDPTSHALMDRQAGTLGAILGSLAKAGRDKLTLTLSDLLAPLGDWIEQLVAESTGKQGKGIVPVVGERLADPETYGGDRVFVDIRLAGDESRLARLDRLSGAGHPVVLLEMSDRFEIGGQMFLWEMATAVAAHFLGVNPFDQPDVESAKVAARTVITRYRSSGSLQSAERIDASADTLLAFLEGLVEGDYLAVQAFVNPSSAVGEAINDLREVLRERFRVATTVGFGPRFLHSTGQLHKGDGGRGAFLQFTSDSLSNVPIPDDPRSDTASLSFQVLKSAQAEGDAKALIDAGRRVVQFRLGSDPAGELHRLASAVARSPR